MNRMKIVPLNSVCEINPSIPVSIKNSPCMEVSFVPMSSLQTDGTFSNVEKRDFKEIDKGYKYFEKGDVILAKITPCMENGKAAFVQDIPTQVAFGSTEFHVLRPKKEIHGKYLSYLIRDPRFRKVAEINMTGTAGQRRVPTAFLERYKILLPPLEEQIRIATRLSRIEGLIARRKESIRLLDEFVKSMFLEMFGDPVRNEKGWEVKPFSEIGQFISGGTPSKERDDFWNGDFPWVSPKDMKMTYIHDSIDHLSEIVFEETALKRIDPGCILIVVRGMILAHSFPVAINEVPVSINQDMKAIKLRDGINSQYMVNCLNAMKRLILSSITTAGHGTKRFDSEVMNTIMIPIPEISFQDKFANHVAKVESMRLKYKKGLSELESL
ncbi:MAG: restriction endonuclease subunit S, partial [Spirochaetes bacterium]